MSEKTLLAQAMDQFDDALGKAMEAETEVREKQRDLDNARAKQGRHEDEARKLRRAINALEGRTENEGEINSLVMSRKQEIKREMSGVR